MMIVLLKNQDLGSIYRILLDVNKLYVLIAIIAMCGYVLCEALNARRNLIALKEPIRHSYLKELRGSNAYEHVQELLEKGLISRHKDKNGRSYNIKTTPKFAEYFKLKGDIRALLKTLNIDNGVKDDPEDELSGNNAAEDTVVSVVSEGVNEGLDEKLG